MATVEDAISIAALAHKGQTDKAGKPYLLHPLRMMMKMESEAAMIVAVLHDVVEDTNVTFGELREKGFSEEVLDALDCVTDRKDQGETYDDFVERVLTNPVAIEVKIADLEDNMDIQRIAEIKEKDLQQLAKYHKAWLLLKNHKSQL